MNLIWATRGRSWGFRFLRDGGFSDPLPTYSHAFEGFEGVRDVFARVGDVAVLRFEDPLGRQDAVGRVVPHEFVVLDQLSASIESLEDAFQLIWPEVEAEYARIYDDLGNQ